MTPALHILLALGTEAKHGYAIMRDAREASGGRVEILPGTLYATLKGLVVDGLVEEVDPPKGEGEVDARRRYYKVTKRGRAHAAKQTEQMAELVKMGRVFMKGAR